MGEPRAYDPPDGNAMNGSIYLDFDDVLCETARMLLDIVEETFGKRIRFEDIHSFDLGISFQLSDKEKAFVSSFFHNDAFLANLPPVEGAAKVVWQWIERGCDVHIVTGRPPETLEVSQQWLQQQGFPDLDITFVDKYGRGHNHVPTTRQMSMEEVEQCPFALIIDDASETIERLAKNRQAPLVLFDRPWNASSKAEHHYEHVRRCRDWLELQNLFPAPGRQP